MNLHFCIIKVIVAWKPWPLLVRIILMWE
jgi:hypothetical protein